MDGRIQPDDKRGPTSPDLDSLAAWSERAFEDATVIPSEFYLSSEVAKLENKAIFGREWICAGREDYAANPGDFFCFSLNDTPIIIVRGRGGELQALLNVCQHRGMKLVEGEGHAAVFSCPYHGWTYNLDGTLRGAPFMQDAAAFDPNSVCLPKIRLECWQGFVYVCLDTEAEPLAPRLHGLDDLLERHQVRDMKPVFQETVEYACNWKLLLENFCESYHLFCVHRKTLEPISPTKTIEVLPGGPGWNLHQLDYVDSWKKDKVGDRSEEAPAKGYIGAVYPSQALAFGSEDSLLWINTLPAAPDRVRVDVCCIAMPDTSGGEVSEEARVKLREHIFEFLAEDEACLEAVQRNLASFKPTQPYCPYERSNWEFEQYAVGLLIAASRIQP
jgi:phenylpropionate dioxygenase-like ring-hydroxylating dioxygenase large terminal subunit